MSIKSSFLDLNEIQQKAMSSILDGKNVFITGGGGVGKTFFITKLSDYLTNKKISYTGTTGMASLLINGTTIHTWSGIGTSEFETVEKLEVRIKNKPKKLVHWMNTDVLVIDEISMLSALYFNKLNKLAQLLRNNTLFFGGIQLILSGDFGQLPPVNIDKMCFETKSWNDNINSFYFQQIYRQVDKVFQTMLKELRFGIVTSLTKDILESRRYSKHVHKFSDDTIIKPTVLYPFKKDVDKENNLKINELKTKYGLKEYIFNSSDSTVLNDVNTKQSSENKPTLQELAQILNENLLVQDKLVLVKYAQVMLIHNIDLNNGLVNGLRGIVVDFDENYPVIEFQNGKKMTIRSFKFNVSVSNNEFERKQLPLSLAFSYSLHKAQGQSISCALLNLKDVFTSGQAYVGLSRVETLDGLYIEDIDYKKITCLPKVRDFYKKLM
jgi:ATP-dependent DNA helicase PIF1